MVALVAEEEEEPTEGTDNHAGDCSRHSPLLAASLRSLLPPVVVNIQHVFSLAAIRLTRPRQTSKTLSRLEPSGLTSTQRAASRTAAASRGAQSCVIAREPCPLEQYVRCCSDAVVVLHTQISASTARTALHVFHMGWLSQDAQPSRLRHRPNVSICRRGQSGAVALSAFASFLMQWTPRRATGADIMPCVQARAFVNHSPDTRLSAPKGGSQTRCKAAKVLPARGPGMGVVAFAPAEKSPGCALLQPIAAVHLASRAAESHSAACWSRGEDPKARGTDLS